MPEISLKVDYIKYIQIGETVYMNIDYKKAAL